ncbi:MAG TPA: hypothetical protein VGF24_06695 [Vicinamibacterales bacterium]|jgi:hypothetical protein
MRASVLSVALFAAACSNSPTTPTPAPTQANLTAAISPNPVTATDCLSPCAANDGSGRVFQWRVQGNVTIQETAGLGGNVNTITVTNFNPPIVYTSDVIAQRSGTSRVGAKGILNVPVTVIYGIVGNVNASRSIVMDFIVSFTDDHGNQMSAATQWTTN